MPVQQVSGKMSTAWLSEFENDDIKWRQDFELRIASLIEFKTDLHACVFLESLKPDTKFVSNGSKIFVLDELIKQIYYYCDIEEESYDET